MAEEDFAFSDLCLDDDDDRVDSRRSQCQECERPSRVCWCPYLPQPRLEVRSRVIVLQHPKEEKRGIRTALMAARGVAGDRCKVKENNCECEEINHIFIHNIYFLRRFLSIFLQSFN